MKIICIVRNSLLVLAMLMAGWLPAPVQAAAAFSLSISGNPINGIERAARFVSVVRNTGDQPGSALLRLDAPGCEDAVDSCTLGNIDRHLAITGGLQRTSGGAALSMTLAAGGAVTVSLISRADYCGNGATHTLTVNGRLQPTAGAPITGTEGVSISCLPVLTADALITEISFPALAGRSEVPPGTPLIMRSVLTNTRSDVLHVGAKVEMYCEDIRFTVLEAAACAVSAHRVQRDDDRDSGDILELPPGVPVTITHLIRSAGSVSGGAFSGRLVLALGGAGDPSSGSRLGQPEGYPVQMMTVQLPSFGVVANDLGDAPDSSNHAGTGMPAYPGVPALFPTVFDAALGVQGPLHRAPRPLHLGRRASTEVEADLGPDSDPRNNLEPGLPLPNLDRADDGINPNALSLAQCQTSTLQVRVFASAAAIAHYKATPNDRAHLNVWVDGNRDGDWADASVFPCAGAGGELPAEHIVRNRAIDVASLSPGMNTLLVPTARVVWDAGQASKPAWLRVSLSDAPAPLNITTGALQHGDGRGIAGGYGLGETEDYLWRPAADRGAALSITVKGNVMPAQMVSPFESGSTAISNTRALYEQVVMQYVIDVVNTGDTPLKNVVLTLTLSGIGANGDVQARRLTLTPDGQDSLSAAAPVALQRGAGTGSFALSLGESVIAGSTRLVVNLSTNIANAVADGANAVASAAAATASVVVSGEEDDTLHRTASAQVSAAGSGNISAERFMAHFVPVIITPRDGTSSEVTGTIRGLGVPNTIVQLKLDARPIFTAQVQGDGRFSRNIDALLAEGWHRLAARTAIGVLRSPWSAVARVNVMPDFLWSPLSLRLHGPHGDIYAPVNARGRADDNGWLLPLRSGELHTVTLRMNCGGQPAPHAVKWEGPDLDAIQAQITGDFARLTVQPAISWPNSGVLTQTVTCGDEQQVSRGAYFVLQPPALARSAANPADWTLLPTLTNDDVQAVPQFVGSREAALCGSNIQFNTTDWDFLTCAGPNNPIAFTYQKIEFLGIASYHFTTLRDGFQPASTRQIDVKPANPTRVQFFNLPEVDDEVLVQFSLGDTGTHEVMRMRPSLGSGPRIPVVVGDTGGSLGHVRVPRGSIISLVSAGDGNSFGPALGWYGCITCTLARADVAPPPSGNALLPLQTQEFKMNRVGRFSYFSQDAPETSITVEVVNAVFLPALLAP